ncbi:MAG: hypothetical protein AAB692_00210 [Patescibacteria group bacterium]
MSATQKEEALGIDIGGVIIDSAVNDGTATALHGDNYLQTTQVKHSFETISGLVRQRFGSRVYLVSKCGVAIQRKTREWLQARDFFAKTGVSPLNLWFCKEHHEKAEICRELGISHFIDDRLEVLGHLATVPNLYLFCPRQEEVHEFARFLPLVTKADGWTSIYVSLLGQTTTAKTL